MAGLRKGKEKKNGRAFLAGFLALAVCLAAFPADARAFGQGGAAWESRGESAAQDVSKDDASKSDGSKDDGSKDDGSKDSGSKAVRATGIKLNKSSLTLKKGKSATLKATVLPANATNKRVSWTTSNKKTVTVKNGKVTAKAVGTAKITARAEDGGFIATCKVTVKVPATKIALNKKKIYLAKGARAKISTSVKPKDTTDKISWKSSKPGVAAVSGGVITAKRAGTATVTAKTSSGKKATVKVVVSKKPLDAKSLKLSRKTARLAVGKTLKLKASVSPAASTDIVEWKSTNKKVASVDAFGIVTAKKAGTATIVVKTSSGKRAECKITVPGVVLKRTSATVRVGKKVQIAVKFSLVAGDKIKSCRSSDTSVATVTDSGKVRGRSVGTATVTVTMKSGVKAEFNVKVIR